MAQSPKTEFISLDAQDFNRSIGQFVKNVHRCYQCSACSDGCPVAYAMEYHPEQVMHMIHLGQVEKVLRSNTMWLCLSCEECVSHCPNGVDIVDLMDALRAESLRRGYKTSADAVSQFHKSFMHEIKNKGRISEIRLMLGYELRTLDFLSRDKLRKTISMGLSYLRAGKLKLLPDRMRSRQEVRKIFRNIRHSKTGSGKGTLP